MTRPAPITAMKLPKLHARDWLWLTIIAAMALAMTRPAPIIAVIIAAILLLLVAYMGAYRALLLGAIPAATDSRLPDEKIVPLYRTNQQWIKTAIRPAHQLDRLIRPAYWGEE